MADDPKLHDEKCPECASEDIDKVLCEDFLEDVEWEEFTCKACGKKWENSLQ